MVDKHDDKERGYGRHDDKAKEPHGKTAVEKEKTPEEEAVEQELAQLEGQHGKIMSDLAGKKQAAEARVAQAQADVEAVDKEVAMYQKKYEERKAEITKAPEPAAKK